MVDLVCFWSKESRVWIVYAVDADGNQLWDADYYANRDALKQAFV